MKRSEINRVIGAGMAFLAESRFCLPPFATWTPNEWRGKGPECRNMVDQQLGWDVTDFGSGDFAATGLLLFTLRNGNTKHPADPRSKSYCEKIMIVRDSQVTPCHFHFQKMEDIINRGGGNLVIRMWNATDDEQPDDTAVTVSVDGVDVTVEAGGTLVLMPGESVMLPPRNYHSFWGQAGQGTVLVGEVSRVNDDHLDNRFLDALRFAEIEEDETPLYLLCNDYETYYQP